MNLRRYGSWALVTGSSTGLGRAFAKVLAGEGINCVLLGLESDLLEDLSQELVRDHGVECRFAEIDLATEGFLDRVKQSTEGIDVDILVNNAGIGCGGDYWTVEAEKAERLVRLNCLAPAVLTREYLPGMVERGRGAVVMVSSVMGFITAPGESVYNGSKAFDLHFGESLWGELRGTPVDAITACPAGMRTSFFEREGFNEADCKRMWRVSDEPEKIAQATLRRLGRKATYAPPLSALCSVLVRFTPRWMVPIVSQFVTKRLVSFYR